MVKIYCKEITKKGHQCKKLVQNQGDICFVHATKSKHTCFGRNKNGSQCKRSVKTAGGKCHSHIIDKNIQQVFKRSSLQRSNSEARRQHEIQKKKLITQKRRMSLIRALRPRSRNQTYNDEKDAEMIDRLLNKKQTLEETEQSSQHDGRQSQKIEYNPKSEYLPENIFHREDNIHCGICLHESRKKGIRLSCCKFRQAICIECTRELLKENYKQTIDSHIDEYNLNPTQLLMRTAFTHCKCPFCRKRRSFKKFMKLLKKKIKNKK